MGDFPPSCGAQVLGAIHRLATEGTCSPESLKILSLGSGLKSNQYYEEKTGIGKCLSGKELQYESDIYIPGTAAPDAEC